MTPACAWDRPVTNAELDAFWGTDQPAPADTVSATLACGAIRAIPAHRFTPAVAAAILATVSARVALLSEAATQYVDDAIFVLDES